MAAHCFLGGGSTPRRTDTINTLLVRIACGLEEGGGNVGSGEILGYTTTGPTADGVIPTDLNHEAIAVKPGGSTFTWDPVAHVWDDV